MRVDPWFGSPPRLAYVHFVEEATKAWGSPQRFAFTLVLKSRKLILEMSGNVLVFKGFYKPPGAATQVGKLNGRCLAS